MSVKSCSMFEHEAESNIFEINKGPTPGQTCTGVHVT